MNKYIPTLLVLLVVGALTAIGTLTLTDIPNEAATVKVKQVVNANNTLTETAVNANLATGTANTALVTAQTDAYASVTNTLYTPRFIGDQLIGTVSNMVFFANGITTNDWIQVYP